MSTAESPLDCLEPPHHLPWAWCVPWVALGGFEAFLLFVPPFPIQGLIGLLAVEIFLIPFAALLTQVMVSRRWDNLLRKLPWEEFCLTRIKPDEFIDWIVEPVRDNIRAGARFLVFSTPLCALGASIFRSSLSNVCFALVGIVILLLYRHALLLCATNYGTALAFRSILYALEPTPGLLRSIRESLLMLGGFYVMIGASCLCIAVGFTLSLFFDEASFRGAAYPFAVVLFVIAVIAYLTPLVCIILLPAYMAIRTERIRNQLPRVGPLWHGVEEREEGYPAEGLLSFARFLMGRMDSSDMKTTTRR